MSVTKRQMEGALEKRSRKKQLSDSVKTVLSDPRVTHIARTAIPFVPGAAGMAIKAGYALFDIINSGKEKELYQSNDTKVPGTEIKPGKKIYSNEDGLGTMSTRFDGIQRNHEGARQFNVHDEFHDGSKDYRLKQAKKLYGSNSNFLYSTEKTAYSRLYAYAGLNTKGVFQPYRTVSQPPAYGDINIAPTLTSQDGFYFTGEVMSDTAAMFKASLLPIGSLAGLLGEMPIISSGDEDYYFPFQSFNYNMRITNTDSFLPCMLKVFVLRARKNMGSVTPVTAWFDLKSQAQDESRLLNTLVNYTTTEAITGCTGTPYTSQNIAPQATPLMSESFKDCFEILKVHRQRLGPSDSLEYTMTKHYGDAHSAAAYFYDQNNGVRIRQDSIHYLIEFQGMPCPFYKTTAAGLVDYSAMAHSSFAKIRLVCNKTFVHSMPLSNASSVFIPGTSGFSPTFVGTKRQPIKVYDETAPYSSFSSNPTAASVYVLPLVTQLAATYAKPLINDPPV